MALASCAEEADRPENPRPGDAGYYTRMSPEGAVIETLIKDDGSFTTQVGANSSSGKVTTKGGRTCFQLAGEGAGESCWTTGPIRPGGTFEATNDAGETFIITYSEAPMPPG